MSGNYAQFVAVCGPDHTNIVVSRDDYARAVGRCIANRNKPWTRKIGDDNRTIEVWESVLNGEGGGIGQTAEEAIAHLHNPARIARQADIDNEYWRDMDDDEFDINHGGLRCL